MTILVVFLFLLNAFFLLFAFQLFILEGGHWQQILEQKVQQNQGVKLKIAIVLSFETRLSNCYHNLAYV
jgi:hypothetical protein